VLWLGAGVRAEVRVRNTWDTKRLGTKKLGYEMWKSCKTFRFIRELQILSSIL